MKLDPVKPKKQLSASLLNSWKDAISRNLPITGINGINAIETDDGTIIDLLPEFLTNSHWGILVKITDATSYGGAVYGGSVIVDEYKSFSTSSDFDYSNGSTEMSCYVVNRAEQGQTTHDIPVDTYVRGCLVHINSDDKPVIEVFHLVYENCPES